MPPNGNFAIEKSIELPGDSRPSVMDVDFDSDGRIAVSASGLGASGFQAGIVVLDPAGHETRFIDTGRYVPSHLAFAPDHSIWTLGWQRDAVDPARSDKRDYRIVRQFSTNGNELKACLPRSLFPAGLEPGIAGDGPQIQVAGERVSILAYVGPTSGQQEWVELDLNGNLLVRSRIDSVVRAPTLAAFTDDDHVYLQGRGLGDLHTFDRVSQTWKSVPSRGSHLLGADGAELVYYESGRGQPIRLQWFPQP